MFFLILFQFPKWEGETQLDNFWQTFSLFWERYQQLIQKPILVIEKISCMRYFCFFLGDLIWTIFRFLSMKWLNNQILTRITKDVNKKKSKEKEFRKLHSWTFLRILNFVNQKNFSIFIINSKGWVLLYKILEILDKWR